VIDSKEYDVAIEEADKVDYDYDSYEKSLEDILEQAQKEFWSICIDFNRHQIIFGRNHLWVAVALTGSYAALYNRFHAAVDLTSILGLFFSLAFLLSIASFGLCLYGMPSRKGYGFPYKENWSELATKAHKRLEQKCENSYILHLTDAIKNTVQAIHSNKYTNSERGRIFRWSYRLLVASFLSCLLSGVVFMVTYNQKEECSSFTFNTKSFVRCIMSNEENSPKPVSKPTVPAPEKPVNTTQQPGTRMLLDSAYQAIEGNQEILTEKKSGK
jgi:hypothetical protein